MRENKTVARGSGESAAFSRKRQPTRSVSQNRGGRQLAPSRPRKLFILQRKKVVYLFPCIRSSSISPSWKSVWTMWSVSMSGQRRVDSTGGLRKGGRCAGQDPPRSLLSLWRGRVDRLIAEVKPKSYREAAGYLRKMCKVYEAGGRQVEWTALLAELRRQHKAKRRLLEILDSLAGRGKKIVAL